MAREVAATAEIDARKQASDMVRQHGRRKAEALAWEYSDRVKAQDDRPRYEAWQAVIRNIVDRTESPAIDSEDRAAFDHGARDEDTPGLIAHLRDAHRTIGDGEEA